MREYTITIKGQECKHLTIVKLKYGSQIEEMTFLFRWVDKDHYMFKQKNSNCRDGYMLYSIVGKDELERKLIEITDRRDDGFYDYYLCPNPSEKRRPTAEELEVNGRFLRKFFIVLGTLFSVAILAENIGWYRYDRSYAHWWEVLLCIAILIFIVLNIWKHRRAKKK